MVLLFRRGKARSPIARSEAGFFGEARPTTVISWFVVGVVLLCAVLVVGDIVSGNRSGAPTGPGTIAAGSPGPSGSAPPGSNPRSTTTRPGSVGNAPEAALDPTAPCPQLPGGAADVPGREPAEIEWRPFRGLDLPVSVSSGPVIEQGNVARCFAHTPIGALLAAMQISVRAEFAPNWNDVVTYQLVPGPGADAYRTRMRSLIGPFETGLIGKISGRLPPAGFKFLGYTPEQAVIALAFGSEGGAQVQTSVYTVVWSGGDWLMQAQPDGALGALAQRSASLDGYVHWGAS